MTAEPRILTPENVTRAKTCRQWSPEARLFVYWYRQDDGSTWSTQPSGAKTFLNDELLLKHAQHMTVVEWRPGQEPSFRPEADPAPWKLGYVTRGLEGPAPVGTVLCDGARMVAMVSTDQHFVAGWVVAREAPPPPPPKEDPLRRVVVEVRRRADGAAAIRIAPHRNEGVDPYVTVDTIERNAPAAPTRAEMELLGAKLVWEGLGRQEDLAASPAWQALVDHVCGKDGE